MAVVMCGTIGICSPGTVANVFHSDRVVAATVPGLVAQRSNEFDDVPTDPSILPEMEPTRSTDNFNIDISGRWRFDDGTKEMYGPKIVDLTRDGDNLTALLVSGNWGELSNSKDKLHGRISGNQIFLHWPISRLPDPRNGYYGKINSDGRMIEGESKYLEYTTKEMVSDSSFKMSRVGVPSTQAMSIGQRSEFDNESGSESDSLDGIWNLDLYYSESEMPFSTNHIKISKNGNKYDHLICKNDCGSIQKSTRATFREVVKPISFTESATEKTGAISVTTNITQDKTIAFGKIEERASGESIFFVLRRQNLQQSKNVSTFLSLGFTNGTPTNDLLTSSSVPLMLAMIPTTTNFLAQIRPIRPGRIPPRTPNNGGRGKVEPVKGTGSGKQTGQQPGGDTNNPHPGNNNNYTALIIGGIVLAAVAITISPVTPIAAGMASGAPVLAGALLVLGISQRAFGRETPQHKPKQRKPNSGTKKEGKSYGDPHLITFDGYHYGFQAVGEFTLVKANDEDFEVQVRQGAVPGQQVSLNTGVAMKIGNQRVAFYAKDFPDSDSSTPVRIDGQPVTVNGTLSLSGGSINGSNGNYVVQWNSGEQVSINSISIAGMQFMNVSPTVPDESGRYVGLLGNLNGDPNDDLQTRGGQVIMTKNNSTYGVLKNALSNVLPIPVPLSKIETVFFDQVYKDFGNSWRITQAESLFDYASGQSTETFTKRGFPSAYASLASFLPPQLQQAEAMCRQAGLGDDMMDGCIFDVANTGQAGFAQAAANIVVGKVKQRVEQEIRNRIPVPLPFSF
jgi:hypothetical protein